jgi:PilZ domain
MNDVETRQVNRDSLFLLAQLRVNGGAEQYRVKVRNLSAGGMMAEGLVPVTRGQPVSVELRNIGWVFGTVAWKQDERFGIAFADDIDPRLARAPVAAGNAAPKGTAHRQQLAAQVPDSKL